MTYLNNAATTVAKPKTVKNAPPASCQDAKDRLYRLLGCKAGHQSRCNGIGKTR